MIQFTTKKFLYLFVFITGASITAVELTASRLLAPYFGNSIFVWGNIIGITLIALAIGYWFGGRLADRRPEPVVLFSVVLIAGVFTTFIPVVFRFIVESVIYQLGGFQLVLIFGSFISVLLLFAFPLVLLAMTSPFIIRLLTKDVATAGDTAGSVYALGTIGSIIGVFISTFVTVPFLGSRETFFLFSFLVLFISSVGLIKKSPYLLAVTLIPIMLWVVTANNPIRDRDGLVYETESPYQYIQIVEEEEGFLSLRTNDGRAIQSEYHPDSPFTGHYYDYYGILPYYLDSRDVSVLNIGLAGGTISRIYTEEVSKDIAMSFTGVEIDGRIIDVANEYFELDKQPITIIEEGGRSFLRRSDEKYDIIIIDAYGQQIYIPFQLTTKEFFLLTQEHVTDRGFLQININAVNRDSKLLNSIVATIRDVYPFVYLMHIPDSYNYFVVAANAKTDFSQPTISITHPTLQLLSNIFATQLEIIVPSDDNILVDNRAPVELLTDAMFFTLINESRLDELLSI